MCGNIIIRECRVCGYFGDDRETFMYLGDGVWSCPNCISKHTRIKEILECD